MLGSVQNCLSGTKSIGLTKQEVHQIALEGFFPLSEFTEVPDKRRSAVVEFGLPYAADPAVSKHVAEFLATHQQVSKAALEKSCAINLMRQNQQYLSVCCSMVVCSTVSLSLNVLLSYLAIGMVSANHRPR